MTERAPTLTVGKLTPIHRQQTDRQTDRHPLFNLNLTQSQTWKNTCPGKKAQSHLRVRDVFLQKKHLIFSSQRKTNENSKCCKQTSIEQLQLQLHHRQLLAGAITQLQITTTNIKKRATNKIKILYHGSKGVTDVLLLSGKGNDHRDRERVIRFQLHER